MVVFSRRHLLGSLGAFLLIHLIILPIPGLSRFSLFRASAGLIGWKGVLLMFGLIIGWGWLSITVSKAEGRANFVRRGFSSIWGSIEEIARTSKPRWYNPFYWLDYMLQLKDTQPSGFVPRVFHRLRYELNTLMNYSLRWQVYVAKSLNVTATKEFIREKINSLIEQTASPGQQKSDFLEYAIGLRPVKGVEKWELFEYQAKWACEFLGPAGKISKKVPGQTGTKNRHHLIFELFNKMIDNIRSIENNKFNMGISDPTTACINNIEGAMGKLLTFYEKTSDPMKKSLIRYGFSQYRDALRWVVLDQQNKNGLYEHPYRFARTEARPFWVKAKIVRDEISGKIKYLVEDLNQPLRFVNEQVFKKGIGNDPEAPKKKIGEEEFCYEVDEKGRVMRDINMIMVENKHPNQRTIGENDEFTLYRKVFPEDIYHSDAPVELLDSIEHEWNFFKDDVLTGMFHPLSMSFVDYEMRHDAKDYGYYGLQHLPKNVVSEGTPAFDREALKDTTIIYRGRKRYFDEEKALINKEPINRYPAVSIRGLNSYIAHLVRKELGGAEIQDKFLSSYVTASEAGKSFIGMHMQKLGGEGEGK